jgi:hypothetical protein
MSANAPIGPEELAGTERESTLRFLEFLGQEITGSRGLAQITDLGQGAIRTLDRILESLAVEAYLQVLKDNWRVVPARFFGGPGTGSAQ